MCGVVCTVCSKQNAMCTFSKYWFIIMVFIVFCCCSFFFFFLFFFFFFFYTSSVFISDRIWRLQAGSLHFVKACYVFRAIEKTYVMCSVQESCIFSLLLWARYTFTSVTKFKTSDIKSHKQNKDHRMSRNYSKWTYRPYIPTAADGK